MADGTIAEVLRGLKGKRVAVSGKTSASYMLLGLLLQHHGMTVGDVTAVELAYASMYPAMVSGSIDAAVELEPYLSQIVQSGLVKEVSDFVELVPPFGACIVPLVYGEAFIARRPAAQAFLTAYTKAVRVYNDACASPSARWSPRPIPRRSSHCSRCWWCCSACSSCAA